MTKAFISWDVDYEDMVKEVEIHRGYAPKFTVDSNSLIATLPANTKTFEDTDYPDADVIYYKVIIKRHSMDFITKYFEIENNAYGIFKIPSPTITGYIPSIDGTPSITSSVVPEISHVSTDWHFEGDLNALYIEDAINKRSFTLPKISSQKSEVEVWARVRYNGRNYHTGWSDKFKLRYDPVTDDRLLVVTLHQVEQYQ